jgi:hypothetical protein
MTNIVDCMDALSKALEIEKTLRDAAITERANGDDAGPMRAAHDASVSRVIALAKVLVEKASNG